MGRESSNPCISRDLFGRLRSRISQVYFQSLVLALELEIRVQFELEFSFVFVLIFTFEFEIQIW